jgi:hypothetical protein
MKMEKTLSSPNSMVWSYFEALRRLCYRVESHENNSHKTQDAALCVILAVTGVEVFMNVYFRILITEEPYKHAKQRILNDLDKQAPLDRKLKEWPKLVFGEKIKFGSGIGQKFSKLKNTRNKLVHFSSTHEPIEVPGVTINGMADTTVYNSLGKHAANEALEVAEGFIGEIFRLRGIHENEICHALHSWTGKVPEIKELTKQIQATPKSGAPDL